MKIVLGISVAINIFLAGVLLFRSGHREGVAEIPSVKTTAAIVQQETQAPRREAERISTPAFRWSQLESADYHTYINNLRGIGCPEQTIRDIVTADVDEAFYISRREQLKQQQTGQALEVSLARLADEETAFVTELLGGTPAPAQPAKSSPPRQFAYKSPAQQDLQRPAFMPLAMQPVDLTAMKLTGAQIQTIQEIRQTFMAEVGTNQNPNDPDYFRRWQAARREADNMLAGMLGRNFIQKYQSELESQAAQPK